MNDIIVPIWEGPNVDKANVTEGPATRQVSYHRIFSTAMILFFKVELSVICLCLARSVFLSLSFSRCLRNLAVAEIMLARYRKTIAIAGLVAAE